MRIVARSARVGRPRRRHRLRGQHPGRHRRLVRRRLRRAARRRPAARALLGACSTVVLAGDAARGRARRRQRARRRRARCRVGRARRHRACCRAGTWRTSRRACSASRSPRTSSQTQQVGAARAASTTTTASPPPSPSSSGARPSRSRTTARSTPPTATTWRRRSWSASCRCVFWNAAHPTPTQAARRRRRLRLGRHHRRGHAVSRSRHADVVELEPAVVDARRALLRPVQPSAASAIRASRVSSATAATSSTQAHGQVRRHRLASRRTRGSPASRTCSPSSTGSWRARRLADDGVFCQWAQLYEMSPWNIKIILRTFAEVFPYTYVFSAEDLSSDVILVATNHPLPLDVARAVAQLRRPRRCAGAQARRRRIGRRRGRLPAAHARRDPRVHRRLAAQHRRQRAHRVRGAARSARLDAHRRSRTWRASTPPSGPTAASIATSSGSATATRSGKTELRLARSLLAHGKRAAAERFLAAAKRHGAPPGTRAAAAASQLLGERQPDDREVPLAAGRGRPDRARPALDPPKLPRAARCADY